MRCLLKCRFLGPIPDPQNQNRDRNVHFKIKCKLFLNRKCMLMVQNLKDQKGKVSDFPGGAVVGHPPANAGDTGSCPGPGRSHMPRSG